MNAKHAAQQSSGQSLVAMLALDDLAALFPHLNHVVYVLSILDDNISGIRQSGILQALVPSLP